MTFKRTSSINIKIARKFLRNLYVGIRHLVLTKEFKGFMEFNVPSEYYHIVDYAGPILLMKVGSILVLHFCLYNLPIILLMKVGSVDPALLLVQATHNLHSYPKGRKSPGSETSL